MNSEYPDFGPVISADNRMLFFKNYVLPRSRDLAARYDVLKPALDSFMKKLEKALKSSEKRGISF